MTNVRPAGAAEQGRLQQKFDAALAMVADEFMGAGLHTSMMIWPLKKLTGWAEEATREADQQR